jgi:hypothetical protein
MITAAAGTRGVAAAGSNTDAVFMGPGLRLRRNRDDTRGVGGEN